MIVRRMFAFFLALAGFLPGLGQAATITIQTDNTIWRTTDTGPASGWNADPGFDDSQWIDPVVNVTPKKIWHTSIVSSESPPRAWFRRVFEIDAPITSATLSGVFDDRGMVYVNGVLVANQTVNVAPFGPIDIAPHLNVGTNLIAAEGRDFIAGFNSATIEATIETVPEPSSIILLAIGLLLLARRRR